MPIINNWYTRLTCVQVQIAPFGELFVAKHKNLVT